MKKFFEAPKFEIIPLKEENVITSSVGFDTPEQLFGTTEEPKDKTF